MTSFEEDIKPSLGGGVGPKYKFTGLLENYMGRSDPVAVFETDGGKVPLDEAYLQANVQTMEGQQDCFSNATLRAQKEALQAFANRRRLRGLAKMPTSTELPVWGKEESDKPSLDM